MINKIFQFVYYKIIVPLTPKNKTDNIITRHEKRFIRQIRLAKLFGKDFLVLIGDSNSERLSKFHYMRQFKGLTIALGVGGTTADDWVEYFSTTNGNWILRQIVDQKIIWDIGGNNSLLNKMSTAKKRLHELHIMTPGSRACLIPPVHYKMLEKIGYAIGEKKTAEEWKDEMTILNSYIGLEWGAYSIDLYHPFFNASSGEAYLPVLQDAVHFSKYVLPYLIKLFEALT